MGWEAEILRQDKNVVYIPSPGIFMDKGMAKRWVEEAVAAEISMEVPPESLIGWIRYGQIVDYGSSRAKVDMLTVTYSISYSLDHFTRRLLWDDEGLPDD